MDFITKILKSVCLPQKGIWEKVWTNMKKINSVKEIQNWRGKQCFAVWSSCFSPLGGFDVNNLSVWKYCLMFLLLLQKLSMEKNPFQTSPSPSIAQVYSQGNKMGWTIVLMQGLQHTSIHSTPLLLWFFHAEVPRTPQRKSSVRGQKGKGETNWPGQSSDTD